MYYLIEGTLKEIPKKELKNTDKQYVVVLSSDEWKQERDSFEWRWGYPVIIVVSLLIAIGGLLFFKKKKWL